MDTTTRSTSSLSNAGGPPVVPEHQLLKLVAKGSYGEVWLARNYLGVFRAVKIVHQSTFRDSRPFDREFKGLLKFEPISRLHEGLIHVLQVGRNEAAGYFYCVMELADDLHSGQAIDLNHYRPHTLAESASQHTRLSIEDCLGVGIRVCSALAFLHSKGLVHRDIKPSNVVFVKGIPKLADIGLVVEMSEALSYVGTEGFIAPEGPGSVPADLYSFGKVLYEISTGKDRYDYPELPTALGNDTADARLIELNKVILQACRSEPRERYQTAAEMLRDLKTLQAGGVLRDNRRLRRMVRSTVWLAAALVCLVGPMALLWPPLGESLSRKSATPTAFPTPAPLAAWWPGETNTTDIAGGNAGIVHGDVSFAPGKVGYGFLLSGEKAWIRVPASPSLDVGAADGLTIESWIKTEDESLLQVVVEWNDGKGLMGTHLCLAVPTKTGGAGSLYANLVDDSEKSHQIRTDTDLILPKTFQHVALTYDKNEGIATLYLNGTPMAQTNLGSFKPYTSSDLYIGCRPSGVLPGLYFQGMIDELSIYGRALSRTEIQSIFEAGNAGKSQPRHPKTSELNTRLAS